MSNKNKLVTKETALIGRDEKMMISELHFINQTNLTAEKPLGCKEVLLGLGCFWGAERIFWQLDGVISTSVGYSGGYTKNPTYQEVCSGETGHTEVVRVIFDPTQITLQAILVVFWEHHDPTQGMRQGNDIGTQYRSAIYTESQDDLNVALESRHTYQAAIGESLSKNITTEITLINEYYLAETYHQQYLAKNPQGYCGIGGTGICFPPNL
ncbi:MULTISPECIES: peptide-methionine (S)-S-oxide reductase MsrA [Vibrio]|uniref:Peptide methionine sulfoxide reductase MsrA n=1 Tax=Vibrio casei TaxID=673372 RepID=A0A368LKS7_9VIBR|nr:MULTISPECIES: peptide-methionine (S)-S-oxide reductase MsrA [Vibrio]RCS72438.1 peptide-methionine (S)-S-oxide reductase MsrA [Vibrio casei]SJN36767.1 Peptide methionine sulfoxide reductase MsrA [Vibrio casei]HBV76608.1 peptide-methionine (S)-S-oxide reductase MsrA [Vibrio sp.]